MNSHERTQNYLRTLHHGENKLYGRTFFKINPYTPLNEFRLHSTQYNSFYALASSTGTDDFVISALKKKMTEKINTICVFQEWSRGLRNISIIILISIAPPSISTAVQVESYCPSPEMLASVLPCLSNCALSLGWFSTANVSSDEIGDEARGGASYVWLTSNTPHTNRYLDKSAKGNFYLHQVRNYAFLLLSPLLLQICWRIFRLATAITCIYFNYLLITIIYFLYCNLGP